MEEKAIRGVPWTFISYGMNRVLSALAMLVLARLLAPADFGLMALALVATSFLMWFGGLSFGAALVVRQELDRRQQGTVLSLSVLGATAAAALAVMLAPIAAAIFDEPRLTGVIAVMSSAIVIGGVTGFYESLLQRELAFRRRFAALAVQTITYAGVAVACAALGAGVWSLVAGQISSAALYAVALLALAPYRVAPRIDRAIALRTWRTGRGFLTQGLATFVRQNCDVLVVGRFFMSTQVGFYSMAYRLGDMTYWAVADPVARVTFPAFARSQHRGEDVRPAFLSVLRLVALVTAPVGVILSAVADPFIRVAFGSAWLGMTGPLMVIGIWAAIRPLESTFGWLLNSVERAGAVGWVSIVVLVPLLPAVILLAQTGDLAVVALVPLGDTLLSLALLVAHTRGAVRLSVRRIWRAVRAVALACPATWIAAHGVGRLVGEQQPVVGLVAASLAGLAAYVGTSWLVDRELWPRARAQIARTMGRAPAGA